jgi:solute carrier family 35 protein
MMLSHMISCVVFSSILKRYGYIQYDDMRVSTMKKALPLAVFSVGNVLLGLIALRAVNIPIFTTLRRLTLVFVLGTSYLLDGKVPARTIVLAIAIMYAARVLFACS